MEKKDAASKKYRKAYRNGYKDGYYKLLYEDYGNRYDAIYDHGYSVGYEDGYFRERPDFKINKDALTRRKESASITQPDQTPDQAIL